MTIRTRTVVVATALLGCSVAAAQADTHEVRWRTTVNHAQLVPGTSVFFNSYNQPAINEQGLVVFRARSTGSQGQPETGIYTRDMSTAGAVAAVFTRRGTVPQPNNALYNGALASFNEFPSVPRVDGTSATIATRGMSRPVWVYTLDGLDTRTGSAGVYTNPGGVPTTGASMLGDVPGFAHFQVPTAIAPAGTGFDQFPGAPSVAGGKTVVFKGNFTLDNVGRTGVFFRDAVGAGGVSPVGVIASSFTRIPGVNPAVNFGSTAPPSAAGKFVVFAGYDNEEAPTAGGIYRARLGQNPTRLEKVVTIGDRVPGEDNQRFRSFGEAISVSTDGQQVLFWGTWGSETRQVEVKCPEEGNAAVRAYCQSVTPTPSYRSVPVHQGFFVRDLEHGKLAVVAKTDAKILDFMYWNFSGRAPGMSGGEGGEDDIEEPARWRTATFGALSADHHLTRAVIKARTVDGADGLYLDVVAEGKPGVLTTLVKTGQSAFALDPLAPVGSTVTALGLERDGFRGNWLAITASMLAVAGTEETTWGGIYAARIRTD